MGCSNADKKEIKQNNEFSGSTFTWFVVVKYGIEFWKYWFWGRLADRETRLLDSNPSNPNWRRVRLQNSPYFCLGQERGSGQTGQTKSVERW